MNTQQQMMACRAALESVKKTVGNEIFSREGWLQVVTPGAKTPSMNAVLHSRLTRENVAAVIQETIDEFSKHRVPFKWVVSPWSAPEDLDEHLLKFGFKLVETTEGLFASSQKLAQITVPKVEVESLSPANLKDWVKVYAALWNIPPQGTDFIKVKAEQALAGNDVSYFMARFRGEPVGIGNVRMFDDFVFLSSGAVKEEFRGQGIYKAMVGHRAQVAAKEGIDWVLTHAVSTTSAPILRRIGFEKICEMKHFVYEVG